MPGACLPHYEKEKTKLPHFIVSHLPPLSSPFICPDTPYQLYFPSLVSLSPLSLFLSRSPRRLHFNYTKPLRVGGLRLTGRQAGRAEGNVVIGITFQEQREGRVPQGGLPWRRVEGGGLGEQ